MTSSNTANETLTKEDVRELVAPIAQGIHDVKSVLEIATMEGQFGSVPEMVFAIRMGYVQ